MNSRAEFALANPVFNPAEDIRPNHTTIIGRLATVCMTVNIGME